MSSETMHTWTLVSQEICTQWLLKCAILNCPGVKVQAKTGLWPSSLSTDITVLDTCVKCSGTVPITWDLHTKCLDTLRSISQPSESSKQPTSKRSRVSKRSTHGSRKRSSNAATS